MTALSPFPVDLAVPLGADRPRRRRRTPALRALVRETVVDPRGLVLPVFVRHDLAEPAPIASMPGVVQHTPDSLLRAAHDAVRAGVGGLMVFGVPAEHEKDATGSRATDPDGVLNASLARLSRELGDAAVLCGDLCLDEFTSHGHCGLLGPDGSVDNDATIARYADMAAVMAEAGAHVVAPSGMMDHQVAAIRAALDGAGHHEIAVMAYSAKYASSFYGPFREAVASALSGDRRTYQMDPANGDEALREIRADLIEAADIIMVKPASHYLDIVHRVRHDADVPVAAYQVSGEYSMIEAASARGFIDREQAIDESVLSIRRAGASIVLTYWATEIAVRAHDRSP